MANVNPLLLVGAVIGIVTALLVLAYALIKDKKETMGFERTMNDGEILRRLAGYAKPYLAKFVVVLFLMLFSIAYDIISPLIVGALEELVSGEFELPRLFAGVAVYAGVLVFSMASTYLHQFGKGRGKGYPGSTEESTGRIRGQNRSWSIEYFFWTSKAPDRQQLFLCDGNAERIDGRNHQSILRRYDESLSFL